MVFIAKLPDENLVLVVASLLLKLFKFRFYSFLKDFLCVKKVILFKVCRSLDTEVFSSLWGKTYVYF